MSDHRRTIAYLCASRCCDVIVLPGVKRGQCASLAINGEVGTFVSWGVRLGKSERTIRSRVQSRHCVKADKPERHRTRLHRQALDSQALANRFLRLPRAALWTANVP